METLLKVDTWLPIFSGFYGTIWESDGETEENELDEINRKRREKEMPPVTWEEVRWSYEEYKQNVVRGITRRIEKDLQALRLVSSIKFQEVRSPREYNFTNDSINVEISITKANTKNILTYLQDYIEEFSIYLKDKYTSYDGFCSSYSPDVSGWLDGETVGHGHKLGSVLQFILWNENGQDYEQSIYENLSGNGVCVYAENFEELAGIRD